MENQVEVKTEDIQSLLEYFSKNTYKARDSHPRVQQIMQKCLALFDLDYNYSVISNTMGELSTNYPSSLVILESEKDETNSKSNNENGSSVNGNGLGNGHSHSHHLNIHDLTANHTLQDSEAQQGPSGGIDLMLESESFIGTSLPNYTFSDQFYNNNSNGNGTMIGNGGNSFTVTNSLSKATSTSPGEYASLESSKLKELCSRARFARCRARFPVSVILYNKTHICRSATLSGGPEIYGRSSFDYFFSGGADYKQYNDMEACGDDEIVVPEAQSDWQLFDRVRSQDIRLLKTFQVHTIVDLMVEKKKVKFGVNVTSSEKVDKENRYSEFNVISLPYPGCEFFKEYRDKGYNAEDLIFEWNQGHVDANICVPDDTITLSLDTDWTQYRNWDLVTLTQKYLKLLLAYVRDGPKGLLVHCISGWDRTPLFISLLRLSLWADGVIHKSLSAEQILYLTVAYDWLLFGHNLEDRLSKGEEIMFFCFYVLKYIVDSEYSVLEERAVQENVEPVPEPEVQPSVPKQNSTRVRNDSDIQLDGVLLEGDCCATSPEGSNWSLSSVESSQSNRSQDNPPTYFQISHDSSWEDCKGAQHLLRRQRHSSHSNSDQNQIAQTHSYRSLTDTNGIISSKLKGGSENGLTLSSIEPATIRESCPLGLECKVYDSSGAEGNRTPSASRTSSSNRVGASESPVVSLSSGVGNTDSFSCSSARDSPKNLTNSASLSSSHDIESACLSSSAVTKIERTSPVAVPASSRVHHLHRPDSTSSASIGSWQLITGPASLRETVSSSDPGSVASLSHRSSSKFPLHLATNGSVVSNDCIEASESSCTLIDELTPRPMTDFVDSMTASAVPEPESETPENELSLPLDKLEPLLMAQEMTDSKWKRVDRDEADDMEDSIFAARLTASTCSAIDGTPINLTPTKEQEGFISGRRDKLQTVRAHFYTLYASAIGFKFKNVNDNGSSGGTGLGFLIGNLLGSKGGRTVNRSTNV